jgi:hypothetical protein
MAATVIEIADAVEASLNAGTFSLEFTAVRTYVPSIELINSGDLQVFVVPRTQELSAALSRRSDEFSYVIGVAVLQRFGSPTDPEAADPLSDTALDARMKVVEEILDHFRGERLDLAETASVDSVRCTGAENDPIFDPDALETGNLFSSAINLTFKEERRQ